MSNLIKIFLCTLCLLNFSACKPSGKDKESTMDGNIPKTGFERVIKIDLDGTLLKVPYGYLAGSAKESLTKWPSDENKIFPADYFEIYVYPKRNGESWVLEPFNSENKEKFAKKIKDGLVDVDSILIQAKKDCKIGTKSFINSIERRGAKTISSMYPDYLAYERKYENKFSYGDVYYIKKDDYPTIITVGLRKDDENYPYRESIGTCIEGIAVDYYPTVNGLDKNFIPTQKDLVEYQNQVEKLILSFLDQGK